MSLGRREYLLLGKDIPIMEIYVSTSKKFFSILDIVAIIAFQSSPRLVSSPRLAPLSSLLPYLVPARSPASAIPSPFPDILVLLASQELSL